MSFHEISSLETLLKFYVIPIWSIAGQKLYTLHYLLMQVYRLPIWMIFVTDRDCVLCEVWHEDEDYRAPSIQDRLWSVSTKWWSPIFKRYRLQNWPLTTSRWRSIVNVFTKKIRNFILCVTIRKRLCKKFKNLISRGRNTAKSLEALNFCGRFQIVEN